MRTCRSRLAVIMSHDSPQFDTTRKKWDQKFYANSDLENSIPTALDDHTHFTLDCGSYLNCSIIKSQVHSMRHPQLSRKNRRSFSAWIVKLNNDNQLIVEGTLECGQRVRTKPITERLSYSKILSRLKHTYHLVGNMDDSQYELPGFVRHRFHTGFPEDWEVIVEIWKRFATSGSNAETKSPCKSEAIIVEKKLKLAIDGCSDNCCFTAHARKITPVDNEVFARDSNIIGKLIKGYCKTKKQEPVITKREMQRSIVSYEPRGERKFKKTVELKQLTAWTPFVVFDKTSQLGLAFKGTLLNSMGHAVDKNHVTDAVHQRISARVIETTTQEFYELIGNLNNTKRDVPKELITWCRYGCPKQMNSFCEKLSILRSEEARSKECSPLELKELCQGQQGSYRSTYEKSPHLIGNIWHNPSSRLQPTKEDNKRKRMLMELNDNYGTPSADFDDDTVDVDVYNKKSHVMWRRNLQTKYRPEIIRNSLTKLVESFKQDSKDTQDKSFRRNEKILPTSAQGNEEKRESAMGQAPCLSYVFHRCAPPTDNILSDGV